MNKKNIFLLITIILLAILFFFLLNTSKKNNNLKNIKILDTDGSKAEIHYSDEVFYPNIKEKDKKNFSLITAKFSSLNNIAFYRNDNIIEPSIKLMATSTIKLKDINNIKGNKILNSDQIYINGGLINAKEYINNPNATKETIEKINKLSEQEKNNSYIEHNYTFTNYKLKEEKEYLFIIDKVDDNYYVYYDYLNIFEVTSKYDNKINLVNKVTNDKFTYDISNNTFSKVN